MKIYFVSEFVLQQSFLPALWPLCSACHYTVLETKNSMRSNSAMNPVTTKNTGNKRDIRAMQQVAIP